nr:MAG: hypothetical protein DIU55_02725 [Bacillota bacterium]
MRRFPLRQALLLGLVAAVALAALWLWWSGRRTAGEGGEPESQQPTGPLAGMVIVVDPGHGGWDPGAVVAGVREKDLTLQVSQLLRAVLEERGARVVLTRTEDTQYSYTVREDLRQRVALAAEHGADLFLSLHANQDRCHCWGAQTFYQKGGSAQGRALAIAIQNRLRERTETTRYALPGDYFVLRTAPVPAAIVEMGFLSNAAERERLQQPDYQRTIAEAIADGVVDYREYIARHPDTAPENPADPDLAPPGR